jgi:SAM-dependent methyltransferase
MVAMAKRRNRRAISSGIVDLRAGDSLKLPFDSAHFDKAYSVHTVYFWSAPNAHLKEVRRILKPGGSFVLGFRSENEKVRQSFPATVYTFRSAEEIRHLLLAACFDRVDLACPGAQSRGVTFAVASVDTRAYAPVGSGEQAIIR